MQSMTVGSATKCHNVRGLQSLSLLFMTFFKGIPLAKEKQK